MKVLVATPIYPPQIGGPATYTRAIETQLPGKGIDLEIVNFGDFMHLPRLVRHYLYYRRLLAAAKRADLILALDPVSVGLPAYYAAKRSKKPLIVKIGGDYAWEQGQQRYSVTMTLDEFVESKRVPLGVRVLRSIQKRVVEYAERIIVPSGYLKNIVAAWGIPREKIEVIYNAVPLEPLGALPAAATKLSHPLVVSACRLVPWKRIDGIIDAVALLRASGTPASLLILGDGPERRMLEERAADKLRSDYLFTGALSHADMLKTVSESDIFVLNSEYEGLSHILIEALSLGMPIVTTPAGGNPELITDGENGILVPFGDTPALADAIGRFLTDPEERQLFSVRARESAKRFSAEAMLTATVALLKRYAHP